MSLGGSIRRLLYWHNDKKRGGTIKKAYDEILKINTSDYDSIQPYLSERLIALLDHAQKTTKYYSDYHVLKLPSFPVVNKQTIIENRDNMRSSLYINQPLHEMHTSGSTGIPFVVQQDMYKRNRVISEIKAMNEFTNYPSHEKMLYIYGNARGVRYYSKKQEFRENIYRMNVGVSDEKTMKETVDFIINKRPYAIHASASNFIPLIDYMRKNNISNSTSIKSVITGGEMVPASLRKSIIETFGSDTKVFVKYSNEEMGILGVDSGIGTSYRLNWADYFFEILKMDSDEPCKIGEMGRIVITDLFNYALPLIRYDTGDIGSFSKQDGRIVIDRLNGKRRDLIYDIYGNPICGATITNLIKEIKNTKMYQLIQNTENEYTFRVVPFDGITPSSEDLLLEDIQKLLGGMNANLTVEYVDDIPETNSQKRRYTVNLYKPQ